MLAGRGDARLVLGEIKTLKFGSMVRPGEWLEVEVKLQKELGDSRFLCKGVGTVRRPSLQAAPGVSGAVATSFPADKTAVSGRFTMRPICKG